MKHKITIYFNDGTVGKYITYGSPIYQLGFFELNLTEENWLVIPSHMIQYIEGEVIE